MQVGQTYVNQDMEEVSIVSWSGGIDKYYIRTVVFEKFGYPAISLDYNSFNQMFVAKSSINYRMWQKMPVLKAENIQPKMHLTNIFGEKIKVKKIEDGLLYFSKETNRSASQKYTLDFVEKYYKLNSIFSKSGELLLTAGFPDETASPSGSTSL